MSVFRSLRRERPFSIPARSDSALLELGEFEAGALDADPDNKQLAWAFDRAMRAAARGGWDVHELSSIAPRTIVTSVPEGFAFYGLTPDMYTRAAVRFFDECRPEQVVVTGIRSIGTTLSAVVAAALEERGAIVERLLVRPEGHPFDRGVKLRRQATDEWIAIVDEGPGLSGSSFCGTARAWLDAGARSDRIVFFPSWDPDPSQLCSEQARTMWRQHRRYVGEYVPPFDGIDISAGMWRKHWLPRSRWPAVDPRYERRKYLLPDGMAKFHGLGLYGAPAWDLSQQLEGFVPHVRQGPDGYLIHDVVDEVIAPDCDREFIEHVSRYLCHRKQLPAGEGAGFDEICEMIRMNVPDAPDLERFRSLIEDQPKVPVDGRMAPHEWIRTQNGFLKTDAVDHCRDHFYPGCQDIAWDIAGVSEEWEIDPELLCHRVGGERLQERVAFYRVAYLALRLGLAELGRQTEDGPLFEKQAKHHRIRLRKRLTSAGRYRAL